MKTEEIEKAAEEYAEKSVDETQIYSDIKLIKSAAMVDFKEGAELCNKYWQEKTRWKSLETEPPTEYRYNKMYLLRTESGSPYLVPLPYKESVKEFLDNGFIDWKEIE